MSRKASSGGQAVADSPTHGRNARFSDHALFFRKFLEKGRTISSAVPSSPVLVDAVLRPIDFSQPATIVELGAGTGPVTARIAQRLTPAQRFIAIENDREFCRVLQRRFPDLEVLEADATQLAEPLAARGVTRVDYVLSGLPTPNLPPRAKVRLWQWIRDVLAPDGMFIQITVAPLVYRQFYDRLFESVKYRMVWRNVPPGGVYYCSRPRSNGNGNGHANGNGNGRH